MALPFLLGLSLLTAQVPSQGSPGMNVARPRLGFRLQVNLNAGDSVRYQFKLQLRQGEGAEHLVAEEKTEEVLDKIDGDKLGWSVTERVSSVAATAGFHKEAESLRQGSGKRLASQRDRFGKLLKGDDARRPYPILPEKIVALGDTWRGPILLAGHPYEIEYTLSRIVVRGGRRTAHVLADFPNGQGIRILGQDQNQFDFDIETGVLVSSQISAQVTNGDVPFQIQSNVLLVALKERGSS